MSPSNSSQNNTERGSWGSRAGFIIAAAGSAVGLGNIWKFPYVAGENGGGAFLILYLLCIAATGVPIMLAELALGRKSKRNIVGAYKHFKKGRGWVGMGWIGFAAAFMILSFYAVVAGWTLAYLVKSMTAEVTAFHDPKEAGDYFQTFAGNTVEVLSYHFAFLFLCATIVIRGIKSGIQKWCEFLMPSLVVILILLMIRSLTLPRAMEGVAFFLKPDFSKVTSHTVLIALGQAFFSLSLGMGIMVTYGSYLDEKHNLLSSSVIIALFDTMIAVLAGMIIFPAVFAMGLEPSAGPGLVFHVLPKVFSDMAFGPIFSAAFFALLAIAALTSGISLLEVVVAYPIDELGWKREKSVVVIASLVFLFGVPSNLSFGLLSEVKLFGMTFFDLVDSTSSNYMLPLGGLAVAVFVGWVWGTKEAEKEYLTGCCKLAPPFIKIWEILICYISPIAVFFILVSKLVGE